jgi:hypothetical protein
MNTKTRQRAMRSFMGALLQSNMTHEELQDLADELRHGSFGKALGELICEIAFNLQELDNYRSEKHSAEPELEQATAIIGRRRLSKKVVQQLMTLSSPWFKTDRLPNVTMRELLNICFGAAPHNEVDKFLSILNGEPADAYLRGIAKRG